MRRGLALTLLTAGLALSGAARAQTLHGPDAIARHLGNAWPVCFGEEERSAPGIVNAMPLWSHSLGDNNSAVMETMALIRQLSWITFAGQPESIDEVSRLIGGVSEGVQNQLEKLMLELSETQTSLMAGPDGWYGSARVIDDAFARQSICTFFHFAPSDEFVEEIEPIFELFPPVESLVGTAWYVGGPEVRTDSGTRSFFARVFAPNQQLFPGSPKIIVTFQNLRMKPQ